MIDIPLPKNTKIDPKTGKIIPKNAILIPKNAKKTYSGIIFDIYQWKQKMYDNTLADFEMLKRSDSVIILAVLDNNNILTISETQPQGLVRKNALVAGCIEPGENPYIAAQRELKEETGYEFKSWALFDVFQPEAKAEWFSYFFMATGLKNISETNFDPGEKIWAHEMSYSDFLQNYNYKHRADIEKFGSSENIKQWILKNAIKSDFGDF